MGEPAQDSGDSRPRGVLELPGAAFAKAQKDILINVSTCYSRLFSSL